MTRSVVLILLLSLVPVPFAGFAFDQAARSEFSTDFSRRAVDPAEVRSGGPPKDGIPAIDAPQFVAPAAADQWLGEKEPVLLMRRDGQVKIYPLQILMWHEIVNDRIGDTAVTVTFCPLCNTGIAFNRRFQGRILDFGTTGRLRNSNLIMYDRQTETWWQQADGKGIAGRYTGSRLSFLPVQRASWGEARDRFPEAQVLSRETGFNRSYGRNPYRGYDAPGNRPFLYDGPTPPEREEIARVLQISHRGETEILPYEELAQSRVRELTLRGERLVVLFEPGTASALDRLAIEEGRSVGSANAYLSRLGERELRFRYRLGRITDIQTGSRWNSLGEAVSGPLQGSRLEPVIAADHFWFSAWAFYGETSP